MTHFWEKMAELGRISCFETCETLSFLLLFLQFFICFCEVFQAYDLAGIAPPSSSNHHLEAWFPTFTCIAGGLSGWPWVYCSRWTFCAFIGHLESKYDKQEMEGFPDCRIYCKWCRIYWRKPGRFLYEFMFFLVGVWVVLVSLFGLMNADDLDRFFGQITICTDMYSDPK